MPFVCRTSDEVIDNREALKERSSNHSDDYFICSHCGKTYQYRKTLNVHIRSHHLGDFFECDHCHFKSGRKFILQRHILKKHMQEGKIRQCIVNVNKRKYTRPKNFPKYRKDGDNLLQKKYDCTECQKSFTRKDNLLRHTAFHHGNNAEDCSYKCDHCAKKFRDKTSLRNHVRNCEMMLQSSESLKFQKKLYTCLATKCELKFTTQYLLKRHYEEIHGVQFVYESLKFESREKFKEWLVDLQRNSASQFSVFKVWKNSKFNNQKMRCHRTGLQVIKRENRLRFGKLGGTKKLDGFCPAEIVFRENTTDKTCEITIQKTHVGHLTNSEEEWMFLSPNCKKKSDIAHKLSLELPLATILSEYQVPSTGEQLEQTKVISYNEIINIAPTNELNSKYQAPFSDDQKNVMSFICDNKESILLFKAENKEDEEYGVLGKKDFAIVFMNSYQKNLLQKYGNNVLVYDSTHKTTPNNFLLHSIAIIDDDWEKVAVAFLLTNRSDTTVLELFLHCIKDRVGVLVPATVITDVQTSFQTAFEVVMMYVPQFTLWCIWQVYECWRKNQKKIKDYKKRKIVIMKLYKLSQMTDIDEFEKKLLEFISNDDPDLQLFIQYFEEQYAHKASHWAYCYRIDSEINTNMEDKICEKMKIKTVYECLKSICTYVDFIPSYDKIKSIHSQRTQKYKVLRSRHHRAVKCKNRYTVDVFNSEMEKCTHTWLISSSEKEEEKQVVDSEPRTEDCEDNSMIDDDEEQATECDKDEEKYLQIFIVQRNINFDRSKTALQCTLCNISFHEFSCTCVDFLIKRNMCKHIHAVALNCRDKNCQCKCSPSSDEMVVPKEENQSDEESIPVNMNDRNYDNESYNYDNVADDNEPHNSYLNTEFIECMKIDITNQINNLNDGETLARIKKFIFCNDTSATFETMR